MTGSYQQLTAEQAGQFCERGFVTVTGAFGPYDARQWLDDAWIRFGYDRDDRATWAEKRIHLSSRSHVDAQTFAPAAWRAAMDLAGGADRVQLPWQWGDGFIANLGTGDGQPWQPPAPDAGTWHKDGDFFRHFLDSPEQALLTFVLWTDMLHTGGGTFVAADSVPVAARFLAAHPEGVLPADFPYAELIGQCQDFVEMTGSAGDVVLLHPYTLHTASQNVLGVARLITNPPLALREPMAFSRPDPQDFSLVERAVLRALAADRLDFTPAAPREPSSPTVSAGSRPASLPRTPAWLPPGTPGSLRQRPRCRPGPEPGPGLDACCRTTCPD